MPAVTIKPHIRPVFGANSHPSAPDRIPGRIHVVQPCRHGRFHRGKTDRIPSPPPESTRFWTSGMHQAARAWSFFAASRPLQLLLLAVFVAGWVVHAIGAYNHTTLGGLFRWIRYRLRVLLRSRPGLRQRRSGESVLRRSHHAVSGRVGSLFRTFRAWRCPGGSRTRRSMAAQPADAGSASARIRDLDAGQCRRCDCPRVESRELLSARPPAARRRPGTRLDGGGVLALVRTAAVVSCSRVR